MHLRTLCAVAIILKLLIVVEGSSAQTTTTTTTTQITTTQRPCIANQLNEDAADRTCVVAVNAGSGGSGQTRTVGTGATAGGGSSKTYVPYDRLTTGPDGQPCMTTGYYEEGTVPTDGVPANPSNPQPFIYANLADSYLPCPEAPRAPGVATPVETPRMVAARSWLRAPLPKPQPSIAPGRAITGKPAYLITGGRTSDSFHENTVLGPLELTAQGRYFVDGGDGTTTGPYASEGKPWPDGDISHEYQTVGMYQIVVTEEWSGTWRLAGETGVLSIVRTAGRIVDFPVEQIQAVVVR